MFVKICNRRNQSTMTGSRLVGAHDLRWKSGLSRARGGQGGAVCVPFPKAIEDRVEMDLPGSSKRLANLGKMSGIWVERPWMMTGSVSEPIKINSQGKEKTLVFENFYLRWHQSCINLKEDCHIPGFPKSKFDRKKDDGTKEKATDPPLSSWAGESGRWMNIWSTQTNDRWTDHRSRWMNR